MVDHFISLSTSPPPPPPPPTHTHTHTHTTQEEQELASSHRAHEGAVASLSEREKRALAAERRMAHQLPTDSAIQRCMCVSVILFSCVD